MIERTLKKSIETAVADACRREFLTMPPGLVPPVVSDLGRPRLAHHGDYASNIAFKLAEAANMPPGEIALILARLLESQPGKIALAEASASGYLNFRVQNTALADVLRKILFQKNNSVFLQSGSNKKVLVRHILPDQEKPLEISAIRAAVYAGCLANLLSFCAYEVRQEIRILPSHSCHTGDKKEIVKADAADCQHFSAAESLKDPLTELHIYDKQFCSNSADRHPESCPYLPASGSRLFSAKDECPGSFYDLIINIAPYQLKTAILKALLKDSAHDSEQQEFIFAGPVNLVFAQDKNRQGGSESNPDRLSALFAKTKSDFVRFFLAAGQVQNTLTFDPDLVCQAGRRNHAFFVQYIHSRCASSLRRFKEPVYEPDLDCTRKPALTEEVWQEYLSICRESSQPLMPLFCDKEEIQSPARELIMHLAIFDRVVEKSLTVRQPGFISVYAFHLAEHLQKYFDNCSLLSSPDDLTCARLALIHAGKQILANSLDILGLNAPDSM